MLDLSLSSHRQIRTNRRFPAERTAGCGCCQTLFPQSNETQRDTSGDHSERVRGVASSCPRTEIQGQPTAPSAGPILQILEQCCGAGSLPSETADWTDAGFQAMRYGSHHHQRHRTGGKDQEGSVQDRKTGGQIGQSAGNLGGCSGHLKPSKRLSTCEVFQPLEICTRAFISIWFR